MASLSQKVDFYLKKADRLLARCGKLALLT